MSTIITDAQLARLNAVLTPQGLESIKDLNLHVGTPWYKLRFGSVLKDIVDIVKSLALGDTVLDVKDSVRMATAASLPAYTRVDNVLTANANGAIAGHASMDGLTPVAGNRILVKNGAAGADNGIYVFTAIGTASKPWKLTRATDADTSDKVTSGLYTEVSEGTTLANSAWILSTVDPIVLNTTALTFIQFSGAINRTNGDISTQAAGDTAVAGTSNKTAAADHKHAMPAADAAQGTASFRTINAVAGTIADLGAQAAGVALNAAAADHVHAHGNQLGGTLHADVVAGVSAGFMTAADKTKLDAVSSIVLLYAGDGDDGTCVFADTGAGNPAGTTVTDPTGGATIITLDRDLYADTITIDATVTVRANGFRLNAKTSIVNNGSLTGNGVIGAVSGAGGAAGSTGGGTAGGAEQAADAAGDAGTTGDPAVGGAGGAGGESGGGRAGGAGGTVTLAAGRGGIRQLPQAALGALFGATGVAMAKGGTGGGAGGSGGGGSTGGTGGGGGGVVVLVSPSITNGATGVIQANGGAGKAGGGAAGGGGGGGGGGLILICADVYTNNGTVEAAAGTFGAGAGTGAVGVAGSLGKVIEVIP